MYLPEQFTEHDQEEIAGLIRTNPFAIITCVADSGDLIANHIPLLMDGDSTLIGHIANMTGINVATNQIYLNV